MMHVSLPQKNALSSSAAFDLLHTAFEDQAHQTPHATALVWEGQRLTYGDLNAAADRVAFALHQRGIGREMLVAVSLASSPAQITALLGILKAGAAYLPLDPEYPPERLALMLTDSRTPLVLVHESRRPAFPRGPWDILTLEEIEDSAEPRRATIPADIHPDDLAYVIYTSGSMGTPKGVAVAHRSVAANLRWRQETFPLTPRDRLLQTYSFSFDPSVWAIFWPLSIGATLVLPPPGGIADSRVLAELAQGECITVMGAGPAVWDVLLSEPAFSENRSLRHAFSGGEALTAGLRRRFLAQFPQAELHNVYGPTETTIDATLWTCPRPDTGESATPIGSPLPHATAWILDERGEPVPDGEMGELWIGGGVLARGYLFRPELTAERFVPDPFEHTPGARLYRTGDLARRRIDGALEYLGRVDDQVKVRGYRIELGEIEAALRDCAGILAAAVVVHEEPDGDKRLTAYLVASPDCFAAPNDLRIQLQQRLPIYEVPSAFVFLEALPLTPHGKVDRAALRACPPDTVPVPDLPYTPASPLEAALCDLWAATLRLPHSGPQDDFFEHGGHSLLATLLIRRVESLVGGRLPLSALLEHPTPQALAHHLAERRPEQGSLMVPINATGTRRPFFFLHGDFQGGGYYCRNIARHLGPAQPFYAFAPHGIEGGAIPDTLEEMARDYLRLIRAVQPAGPYQLGGYCNGGLVAYEIARQLRASGEEVRTLWLIEVEVLRSRFKQFLRRWTDTLGSLRGLSPSVRRDWYLRAQKRWMPVALMLKDQHDRLMPGEQWARTITPWFRHAPDTTEEPNPLEAPLTMLYAHLRRHTQYLLREYDGPLTLVRASEFSPEHVIVTPSDWLEMAPQAEIITVSGDHFTCLTQHVDALAETLERALSSPIPAQTATRT